MEALKDKTLVMLVGPTAVGKSTIMNQAVKLDAEFKRVLGFTTRPPRHNDEPGQYRYLSDEEVKTLIKDGKILQYAVNPANNHIYGTTIDDYPGKYNMKDTLSGAVEDFTRLPFKSCISVSLSTPVDTWHEWLTVRYPKPSVERTMRLREARSSIEWSLARVTNHQWLINRAGEEYEVTKELITLSCQPKIYTNTPDEPMKMLKLIDDLLSYD